MVRSYKSIPQKCAPNSDLREMMSAFTKMVAVKRPFVTNCYDFKADGCLLTKQCPRCGNGVREDTQGRRKMLCVKCGPYMDRNIIAAMDTACKAHTLSPGFRYSRGDTGEAQSGNEPAMSESGAPVIRIVDASESTGVCV